MWPQLAIWLFTPFPVSPFPDWIQFFQPLPNRNLYEDFNRIPLAGLIPLPLHVAFMWWGAKEITLGWHHTPSCSPLHHTLHHTPYTMHHTASYSIILHHVLHCLPTAPYRSAGVHHKLTSCVHPIQPTVQNALLPDKSKSFTFWLALYGITCILRI